MVESILYVEWFGVAGLRVELLETLGFELKIEVLSLDLLSPFLWK